MQAAVHKTGLPVVLKAEGMAHKTEAGGVAVGLRTEAKVIQAACVMPSDTFLVEEMISGGVAELLIGVLRDPAHGFVLTIGAGGTLTEILDDAASVLLPASDDEIMDALNSLRIAPVLHGYRGEPGVDMAEILRATGAVQAYVAAEAARLEEVEINPLICTPDRAVAVDALIRIGEKT